MPGSQTIDYQFHPLRETLYNELHIRPFYTLEPPQQMTHLAACCTRQDELEEAFELLCDLCRRYDVNQPQPGTVSYHGDFGKFVVHWERHAEFYSLTMMQAANPDHTVPFAHTAIELLPADWLNKLPGHVIAAFHLIIDPQQLNYAEDALTRYFEGHPVMVSSTYSGNAQIYTAFKLHGDGFSRFIVCNYHLNNTQVGQLVRRLTDMETYRLLAMIALPLAKKIAPQLLDMDKQLAEILTVVTNEETTSSERDLLEKLTRIEARLEAYRAETNQRFSATKAYHQLVKDRLEGIMETRIDGYLSIGEFIIRRLNPASRTCESVREWLDDLSKRIERASVLMRTRANLTLQEQNRLQLAAMNRRSKLQFRLQETVEGLSIAAISYYAVGLLGYLMGGFPLEQWGLNKNLMLAITIPFVLISVWLITRRIKRRLIHDQDKTGGG